MFKLSGRNKNMLSTAQVRAALSNIVPKKLNKWSASLLALLIFVPVFVVSLVKANQSNAPSTDNSAIVTQEVIVDEPVQEAQNAGSQVELKANTKVQNNASSQVKVQGSVSTTTDAGTKTETFEKTYNSNDGAASNSFNVNVNVKSNDGAEIDVDTDSDSDVEVDFEQESEVRIRD